MKFFFVDDSRQRAPTRSGMGPLVAIGGLVVPADNLRELEASIELECGRAGFPAREEFKWSPRRGSWMYHNLVENERRRFLESVVVLARAAGCTATVIIEDVNHGRASSALTPEFDVTQMFLERVTLGLGLDDGVVIVDRPGGDRSAEEKFLLGCIDALQSAAGFIRPDRVAISVLCTSSQHVRLLQLADLITGATLAFISGEYRHSPAIFQLVKQILRSELGRIGGVGVKIHPDFRYANLYHWLLGDKDLVRYPTGIPLPILERPYSKGPDVV